MSVSGRSGAHEGPLGAEIERRRMVVMRLAAACGVLTALAAVHVLFVTGPLATVLVHVAAVAGYGAAFYAARQPGRITLPAAILLATMQFVVSGAALTLKEPVEIGTALMFQGLIPLVAAATVRPRGTLLATLSAVGSILLVFALQLRTDLPPLLIGRALGASIFFVLVAGVVAVLAASAASRSLQLQIEQEEAAAQAKAAAAIADQRFRIMADQVSDLISVHDAGGRFTFASASYRNILDVDPASLIGRWALELLHPEDVFAAQSAFSASLDGQTRELTCRARKHDGYRTFHLRIARVELDGISHVAVAARDVTQLQQLSAEIEAGRRMDALGRLASGVAHDFNNLLSIVRSCAAVIGEKLPAESSSLRELAVIDGAVQQAATLTGQLLSFARSQVLPGGRTKPSAVIAKLEPLLQRAVGAKVTLELEPSSSVWETPLGDGQVEQIIMNLAVNARDAMPMGGRLRIRIADTSLAADQVSGLPQGDYIRVDVSDTGHGMTPDVQAQIFEPFFSTKSARGGTGLGLATSFGLARQVGGTLTVESSPGKGSTFRLYLLRAASLSEEAPRELPTQAARAAERTSLRVLVVDDDERVRELTARVLELYGHRAVTAGSAEAALERAESDKFDTILTDVVLGREDGLEILAKLRRLQPSAKAIVMSGFIPSPERLDALRDTDIVFLPKPFSGAALQAAIATPTSGERAYVS